MDKIVVTPETFFEIPRSMVTEISVQDLQQMIQEQEDFELIDVREKWEYETANISGKLIPLQEIPNKIGEIPADKKVVIHCRSGVRSAQVIKYLVENHGYQNLLNLKGGILAWADEIDPSVKKY